MVRKMSQAWNWMNRMLQKLDSLPLWWVGLFLVFVLLLPNWKLGMGSVFTVHDQLDESMMNYVLTARHPGESTIPEMLNGINATGLEPSAVLFVPLYACLPAFAAFMVSYVFMVAAGFFGMYAAVKEITESSILAVAMGGVFCLLPLYPVYGLSQIGIPLMVYAFLCLQRKKKVPIALGIILLFGLSSHLVYTGYVVLGFWGLALVLIYLQKNRDRRESGKRLIVGFLLLLLTYVVTNYQLFAEILLGQGGYVSHREEMVNSALPFGEAVWTMFTQSGQHAFTYHGKLLIPIVVLLVVGLIAFKKLNNTQRKLYMTAVSGFVILFGIAVFYGVCKSAPVVAWKNSVTGFLHYFQIERVYWLYPSCWYLELALCFGYWWQAENKAMEMSKISVVSKITGILFRPVCKCILIAIVLLPTANTVLRNSYFYQNVNQYNNGSEITGYISWESYYAEDLMQQIDEAIGREKSDYRIAHLGVSPAPALMHGFYTVDGYSNNYPLEYKHEFRQVIAKELEAAPTTAVYFDKWGNRCYLFNSQTGNYWMLEKGNDAKYEGLNFDMDALKKLGCEYLLSGAEIVDYERMGLTSLGYFETEKSYWGIWLYRL